MKSTLMLFAAVLSNSACADTLSFLCSWDDKEPIKITVDIEQGVATRSDGGRDYEVVKVTNYAVWLMVKQPSMNSGLAIQMIQRMTKVNEKSGKWIDYAFSVSGTVAPVEGGVCWETRTGV